MTARVWTPPAARAPIGIEAALEAIEATDIVATFTRPRDFDDGYSLPGRIYGAVKDVLLRSRETPTAKAARRRQLFGLPPAFDVFCGEPIMAPERRGALDAAPSRPYALFADSPDAGKTVRVTVRILGAGRVWIEEVRDALHVGLTRNGISVAPLARARARIPDVEITEAMVRPKRLSSSQSELRLVLASPLNLNRAGAIANDASAIMNSAFSRAAGALAWCGYRLVGDAHQFSEAARRVELKDSALNIGAHYRRFSTRQNRRLDVMGVTGAATLAGIDEVGAAAISCAHVVGLGSDTTRGFGRIDIASNGFEHRRPVLAQTVDARAH